MSAGGQQPRRWAASAQLAEELDELRRKFSDLEVQLKDELRLRDRLLQEEKANDQQALNLEKKLAEIRSKHRVDVAKITAQTEVMRKKDDEKLKRFAAIRDELRVSLEPFDNVLMENNRLHENLQVLLHDLAKESQTREEHTAAVKQRNFHTRLKLEATYRRAVEELTLQYQLLARDKMQAESDAAVMQNIALREALGTRSNDVMRAMKRHLHAAAKLHHMRVEHSLLETATKLGKEKVLGLENDVANQAAIAHSYEGGIEELQHRIEELNIGQREMDQLVDDLLTLEAQCHQATEKCQRLRETALHKAKAVVNDAKNLDAGIVAIMGDDAPATASPNTGPSTNSTSSTRATKELSIDLIWQAHHATDLFQPQPHNSSSVLTR